jgi:hypothetical protein
MRLSMSSLAGTARTEVAVGTERLAAMFWAVRAAAPRSLLTSASEGGGATAGWLGLLGALAGGAAGALGALGVLGAAAGAAGTAGTARAAGAAGAAGALALALAEGDAAFSVSPRTPSGRAGCDPVPFPRVGR